ncbi:hypothetical protein L9F63_018209, partial [Diploptera punctata]
FINNSIQFSIIPHIFYVLFRSVQPFWSVFYKSINSIIEMLRCSNKRRCQLEPMTSELP